MTPNSIAKNMMILPNIQMGAGNQKSKEITKEILRTNSMDMKPHL